MRVSASANGGGKDVPASSMVFDNRVIPPLLAELLAEYFERIGVKDTYSRADRERDLTHAVIADPEYYEWIFVLHFMRHVQPQPLGRSANLGREAGTTAEAISVEVIRDGSVTSIKYPPPGFRAIDVEKVEVPSE